MHRLLLSKGAMYNMGACVKIRFRTGDIILAGKAFLGKLVRVNQARVENNHVTRPTTAKLARRLISLNVGSRQVGAKAPIHVSTHDIRFSRVTRRPKRGSFRGFSCVSASRHILGRLDY